jgi:hypothetical protein
MTKPNEYLHTINDANDGLRSAAVIGDWVAEELGSKNDGHFAVRYITNEVHRWFTKTNGTSPERLLELTAEPPNTGDPRYDALIEGIVARMIAKNGWPVPIPGWTQRTVLETSWAPFGDVLRDDDCYLLSFINTPAELKHKHIVFDRKNLERL